MLNARRLERLTSLFGGAHRRGGPTLDERVLIRLVFARRVDRAPGLLIRVGERQAI